MKPFSKRFNQFIEDWFEANKDKFKVYPKSQFNFDNIEETFKLFTDHYREFNTIPMWYDDNTDNIFADTTINAKFRAWHDYTHIFLGADFTLQGEIEVYKYQSMLLPLDWEFERKLMYCEIVKQAEFYTNGGKRIKNQRKFTKKYLNYEETSKLYKNKKQ